MAISVNPKLGVVNVENNLEKILAKANINVKHYEQADKETIVDEILTVYWK